MKFSGQRPDRELEAPKKDCARCRLWRSGLLITLAALALSWWFGAGQ